MTSQDQPVQHRWPWWHRQTPTTRRTIRACLALMLTGLFSLVIGVTTASTESTLGPHEADYAVTLDREVTLNLGPLGSIILDSPLPWPLGLQVVVHEIPGEILDDGESPLPGLAADLAAYGQLFSVPEAAITDAANALVADALGRTMVLWSMLLLLIAAGRLASRGRLREEVKAALMRPGVPLLVVAVALAAVVVPVVPAMRQQEAEGFRLRLLYGTPLEDARITGRLASLIDTYGSVVVGAYRDNEAFYAEVSENLASAYAEAPAPREPAGPPVPAVTETATDDGADGGPAAGGDGGTADESGTPGDDAGTPGDDAGTPGDDEAAPGDGGTDGDAASPSAPQIPPGNTESPDPGGEPGTTAEPGSPPSDEVLAGPAPAPDAEPVTFLFVSDLHCNIGMGDVIGQAAELAGAQAVLDAGDTVMSGTSVESFCINAFAGGIPDDLPWVMATGNHDSELTADQARAAGFTVLDGEVIDVAGVSILGATDPTLTPIGEGTRQERAETIPELSTRLGEVACSAEEPVDVLLVHNPRAGEATLEQGCADLQLSGHWHRRVGPEPSGQGVRLVSTSSGGGAEGGTTMGPLRTAAEMTVVRIDAASGTPMDYRTIEIRPDASVQLGDWFAFPEPGTGDEAETAADGDSDGQAPTNDGADPAPTDDGDTDDPAPADDANDDGAGE